MWYYRRWHEPPSLCSCGHYSYVYFHVRPRTFFLPTYTTALRVLCWCHCSLLKSCTCGVFLPYFSLPWSIGCEQPESDKLRPVFLYNLTPRNPGLLFCRTRRACCFPRHGQAGQPNSPRNRPPQRPSKRSSKLFFTRCEKVADSMLFGSRHPIMLAQY